MTTSQTHIFKWRNLNSSQSSCQNEPHASSLFLWWMTVHIDTYTEGKECAQYTPGSAQFYNWIPKPSPFDIVQHSKLFLSILYRLDLTSLGLSIFQILRILFRGLRMKWSHSWHIKTKPCLTQCLELPKHSNSGIRLGKTRQNNVEAPIVWLA